MSGWEITVASLFGVLFATAIYYLRWIYKFLMQVSIDLHDIRNSGLFEPMDRLGRSEEGTIHKHVENIREDMRLLKEQLWLINRAIEK